MTIQPDEQNINEFRVFFTRNQAFRTFAITGAFGGMTPQGEIAMALYVDRNPYPSEVIYRVANGQVTSDEVRREQESGIERELQAEIRMSLAQATSLRDWLSQKIIELTEARRDAYESQRAAAGFRPEDRPAKPPS